MYSIEINLYQITFMTSVVILKSITVLYSEGNFYNFFSIYFLHKIHTQFLNTYQNIKYIHTICG